MVGTNSAWTSLDLFLNQNQSENNAKYFYKLKLKADRKLEREKFVKMWEQTMQRSPFKVCNHDWNNLAI